MESRPLVTLCECAGSMAYVHEECILDWISLKMTR
jgi:E3 ubiquitin-protein ligase DOA10